MKNLVVGTSQLLKCYNADHGHLGTVQSYNRTEKGEFNNCSDPLTNKVVKWDKSHLTLLLSDRNVGLRCKLRTEKRERNIKEVFPGTSTLRIFDQNQDVDEL